MFLKNKYNISKTYKSFVGYFRIYRSQIKFELLRYERSTLIITEDELDEYAECKLLQELDDNFFSILSFGEKTAIEVLTHNRYNLNPLCERLLQDAYEKWINIFFNENIIKHYHKLDSRKIGMKMKIIRENNEMSKTELAERLKVSRKTIILIEKGNRLPSLEYTYNFCKIFDISIEKLIK